MRCTKCKNKVIQKSEDSLRVRLEGPLELTGDACKARCYWCKSEIELPLILDPKQVALRYVLRKASNTSGDTKLPSAKS